MWVLVKDSRRLLSPTRGALGDVEAAALVEPLMEVVAKVGLFWRGGRGGRWEVRHLLQARGRGTGNGCGVGLAAPALTQLSAC
jgi:hypothetical protein